MGWMCESFLRFPCQVLSPTLIVSLKMESFVVCFFLKLHSTNLALLSLQKSLAVVLVAVDPGLSGFSGSAWITALGLRCYSHFLVIVTLSLRDHQSVGSAFRYLHFQVIVNFFFKKKLGFEKGRLSSKSKYWLFLTYLSCTLILEVAATASFNSRTTQMGQCS